MKTNGLKTMSFGFSAVNAGQRNVSVEPQIIAVSTEGTFRLTPPVSKALGIGHGDYVMFLTNVDSINEAISSKHETIVEFCEANGLDIDSSEAAIAIHKEFDMLAVAKGVIEYDAKGNQKTTTERLTKNDKVTYVSQNFDDMLTAALEHADDEIKELLTRDGVTKDEQIDVLTSFVVPRELPKYKGSKAANPAGLSGVGTSVTFTDSNVWNQIKADMGDEATKFNRVFDIDVEQLQEIEMSDGYKTVTVKALVLGDYVDKKPVRVGKTNEEE